LAQAWKCQPGTGTPYCNGNTAQAASHWAGLLSVGRLSAQKDIGLSPEPSGLRTHFAKAPRKTIIVDLRTLPP